MLRGGVYVTHFTIRLYYRNFQYKIRIFAFRLGLEFGFYIITYPVPL